MRTMFRTGFSVRTFTDIFCRIQKAGQSPAFAFYAVFLLDGRREAECRGDVLQFLFAEDVQLRLGATVCLDESDCPGEFVRTRIQFVAVLDVFDFEHQVVEESRGRNFEPDIEREIVGALGVFRLDGDSALDCFRVYVGILGCLDVGDFSVEAEVRN